MGKRLSTSSYKSVILKACLNISIFTPLLKANKDGTSAAPWGDNSITTVPLLRRPCLQCSPIQRMPTIPFGEETIPGDRSGCAGSCRRISSSHDLSSPTHTETRISSELELSTETNRKLGEFLFYHHYWKGWYGIWIQLTWLAMYAKCITTLHTHAHFHFCGVMQVTFRGFCWFVY